MKNTFFEVQILFLLSAIKSVLKLTNLLVHTFFFTAANLQTCVSFYTGLQKMIHNLKGFGITF